MNYPKEFNKWFVSSNLPAHQRELVYKGWEARALLEGGELFRRCDNNRGQLKAICKKDLIEIEDETVLE